jgi:hypothetical protein
VLAALTFACYVAKNFCAIENWLSTTPACPSLQRGAGG